MFCTMVGYLGARIFAGFCLHRLRNEVLAFFIARFWKISIFVKEIIALSQQFFHLDLDDHMLYRLHRKHLHRDD